MGKQKSKKGRYTKVHAPYSELEAEKLAKELDIKKMYDDSLVKQELNQKYDERKSIGWGYDNIYVATILNPLHHHVIDDKGNLIIPYDLKFVDPQDEVIIYTRTNGLKGASSYDGVLLVPPKYHSLKLLNSFFVGLKMESNVSEDTEIKRFYYDVYTIAGVLLNEDYLIHSYEPFLLKNGEFGLVVKGSFSEGEPIFQKKFRAIPTKFAQNLQPYYDDTDGDF